ncbi:MAG: RNA polymerase sigma factor [Chitinophagaceae bacterium]
MPDPSSYDEKELLAKVAGGDEAGFRQLFLQWHQLLASYIFRITESKELSEEIMQDVFLKIWMVRESLEEINHFKSYLLAVSRNQTYDVLKKLLKEKALRQTWEKENKTVAFENEIIPDTTSSLIDQAIDSLPPRRKEVYLLSRHERLSYKEVAEKLGISTESVKTHLKLASTSIAEFIRSHWLKLVVVMISFFKIH